MRRDHGAIAALGAAAALAGLARLGQRAGGSRSTGLTHRRLYSPHVERYPWADAQGRLHPKTCPVLYESLEPDEDHSAKDLRRLSADLLTHGFDELIHRIPFSSWLDEAVETHPFNEILDEQTPLNIAGHAFEVVGWAPLHIARPSVSVQPSLRVRRDVELPNGEPALATRTGEHTVSLGSKEGLYITRPGTLSPHRVLTERPSPYLDSAVDWADDGLRGGVVGLVLRYLYSFDALRPSENDLRRLAHDAPQVFSRMRGLGGRHGYRYPVHPNEHLTVPRGLFPVISERRHQLGLED